ncbi:hypothetical protein HHL16_14715 [Pseudoflavitalea sp. G-6-1-2]|uniref:hypothetical protein n=1 Tax=Pseudoflavitalea sp. G-6-1-2 TaxID=2728841 RepID=UPI00146B672F|nr:hypothetical protein [Pseudoflavitalea sp. G-6-1-2]NML22133.1 hypothetical protein [Pseudoflavitalea sp. G-6-1-2]
MKFFTLLLLSFTALIASCDSSGVPNKVKIKKTAKHQQIPGTRIFMEIPDDFTSHPRELRLFKDKQTYINIYETDRLNFKEYLEMMKEDAEKNKTKKIPYYLEKDFKIGNDKALIHIRKGETWETEYIHMKFGNKQYMVLAFAQMPAGNLKLRKKIIDAMLSMYVDTTAKADFSAFADFTIDLTGTALRFDCYSDSSFYYSPDGKGDTYFDPMNTDLRIQKMDAVTNLKTTADSMIIKFSSAQSDMSNRKERSFELNGLPAYEITYDATKAGIKVKVYQLLTGNKNKTICFTGKAFDKELQVYDDFVKIAKTLKL